MIPHVLRISTPNNKHSEGQGWYPVSRINRVVGTQCLTRVADARHSGNTAGARVRCSRGARHGAYAFVRHAPSPLKRLMLVRCIHSRICGRSIGDRVVVGVSAVLLRLRCCRFHLCVTTPKITSMLVVSTSNFVPRRAAMSAVCGESFLP